MNWKEKTIKFIKWLIGYKEINYNADLHSIQHQQRKVMIAKTTQCFTKRFVESRNKLELEEILARKLVSAMVHGGAFHHTQQEKDTPEGVVEVSLEMQYLKYVLE